MNSKFFSLFLVTILGFSAVSVQGNDWSAGLENQYSINLSEDLTISSGFGQKIGDLHKITLSEQLVVSNHDKYQKLVTTTKQIIDRYAIMDRVAPNTRVRLAQDEEIVDNSNQVTITDYIEIITDVFYDGGVKAPSMPSIPLAFATNLDSNSLQLLQVNERYGEELESVYSDTGPPWVSNNQKSFSQIFLDNTPNFYQIEKLDNFTLPELDYTQTVLIIVSPAVIYIILVAEGAAPSIRPPKIPQTAGFYFLFSFFVFTTFSTPFAIGNNTWESAFATMDNSTSTNSTQVNNSEDVLQTNMTQIENAVVSNHNGTVTETDNVADGPKHYSISISEGLIIGDGSPANNHTQEEPVIDETSEDIQISESVSFSDSLGEQSATVQDGIIYLNEEISITDEIEIAFGISSIKISESVSFNEGMESEIHVPLNVSIMILESLELSSQIAINGLAELKINEFLRMSEKIVIYTPNVRINEHLQAQTQAGTQFTQITLNQIPVSNLLPQNTTLTLNGTSYLETSQHISESANQMTISTWVKPRFNDGTPQLVAVSKELTFKILVNNIEQPHHFPAFAIYDGMKWHQVHGTEKLEENRWHHVAGVVDNSEITIFVDSEQGESISIPSLYLVNEQGSLGESQMGISVSENDIVIGAEYDNETKTATSKFAGQISGISIHNKALDVEFIKEVLESTAPYSTTEINLDEFVSISDIQGFSGNGAVKVNEAISFFDSMDSGTIILPKIFSEQVDLIALNGTFTNSTIALNGTGFVTVQDTISASIDTMSISAWIKPEFNSGTPQFTITSKENSFNLYVTNIDQPPHTVGFSVFDGIRWNSISANTALDERWHHVIASVNGSKIALYVDGNLEDELLIQNEFSIGSNGQYIVNDSQISVSDSEIVVGAYVSSLREEIKTSNKFVGKIASVDVYTDVLNIQQIAHKYETELLQFYKTVSLYEEIQIGDFANLLYEFIINEKSHKIDLNETVSLIDSIIISGLENNVNLNEILILEDAISVNITSTNPITVNLEDILSFDEQIIAMNPFVPSVNPEIQMVKSGFLITENPKFELEYYSEDEAVKIDHMEIVNATSIANKVQENLAQTPGELLTVFGSNEISTAMQVIETRNSILELEEQVEQIPEDAKIEDIKEIQEKVEEVSESIEDTAKKLEETHLENKAEEIEKSADIIREAADITQSTNQTGIWNAIDENITTRIISPDGVIFADEALFEKEREGKFDVEILSDAIAKPGIYTIESVITVDGAEYTINEEFAWGLVSLNTKKSTYYPGETAEFEIVVLDSVGSPVCDANLVMSINGTTLSSGAGIVPNAECGIYDAVYDSGIEGTYHVNISAIAEGIQTGFETTFDVASFVEFDIIRTAQSKIDPVNNPNEFEVIIDVTSHTDTTNIQIVESVPSVFEIVSDGIVSETADGKTITWDKILQDNATQIGYKYSVPMVFPELFPLGEMVINYENKTSTEARPWFVANDPDIGTGWSSKILRINSTLVSGSGAAVTNVPILVRLTDDPDLSTTSVGSSGQGIRFTSDGANLIDFEIESYSGDGNSGSIEAWVEVPTLSASVDTNLWIHYGKTTALSDAAQTADDLWEGKSYVVVNHLDHDLDTNNNTKELQGSVIGVDFNSNNMANAANQVTGQIGKAIDINQGTVNNEKVCLEVSGNLSCNGSGAIFDTAVSVRTSSLWYKADTVASSEDRQMIFEEGGSTNGQNIYIYDGRIYGCTLRSNDATCGSTTTTAGEWHHVALLWNSNAESYLYHDGERVATFTGKQNANHGNPSALGNIAGSTRVLQTDGTGDESLSFSSGAYDFPGIIDEFRVTNTGLSADLISNMYNSEKYPTNFVRDGIYLSETLSVSDSLNVLYIEEGSETIGIDETLSFIDSAATTSDAEIETAWNKKVLSTNSTLVSGSSNISNVPILVKLTNDPDLSSANVGSDGKGIRFTSDGSTIIDYEIESYSGDSDSGSVTAWVEIPTLDYNDNTYFYIHYGQPELSSIKYGSGVWDGDRDSGTSGTQRYAVVNHLHSTPDGNNDDREIKGSAASDNVDDYNSMNMNGESPVTGKTGLALDFDGSNEYICLNEGNDGDGLNCSGGDSSAVFDGSPVIPNRTVSLWYNADVVNDANYGDILYEEGGATNGQNIYLRDSKLYAGSWTNETPEKVWMNTPTTANEWHHVVFVMREGTSANLAELWHDGVKVKTSTGHNALGHSNDDCLGKNCSQTELEHDNVVNEDDSSPNSKMMFDGTLDEFRVIDVKLPDEFIITTYNSENDPGNFVCEGICLTESVSLSDNTSHQGSIKLSESISLSDSVSKTTNILLTESVLLTDVTAEEEEEAGGGEGGEEREPEEVIELISFTDSITKEINKHLSESITLTDSYSNQVEILLSESVALTDAITDEKSVTQSLTESVSLTDSVGKDVTTALTESITLTDDMSKSQEVALSESLVLSDTTPSIPINIIAMDAENLLNPEYVELFTIDGKTYAIVTQPYEDKVTIYDISDPANIVVKDTETDGENGFNTLNEATGVDTFTIGSSTYAIVNSGSDSGVQIIDVSDPTNIVARDAEWDDDNGFTRLDSPLSGVETFTIGSSTYAIVTDKHLSNGGVQIIDVSDPTDIVARDAETDGENGFTELQGAYAADIFTIGSSTYAIVTAIGNWNSNGVQIIDVSDPANIVAKDAFTHANLAYPGGVETYTIDTSTYAIVTGYTADTVQILDVSDPANIVAKDSLTNSGSLELDGAFEIDVFTIGSSTYAIITGYDDDGVQIIDVSDPANIVAKDSLTNSGSLELDGATDVETFVIGTKTYAIIVSVNTYQGNDGGVQILQLASDDEFAKKSANVSLSESITLTDAITDEATITLSESITLTDAINIGKDVTTALTESITLTDDISVGKNVTTALTESITLTDNTSIGSATTASLSESVSFSDNISKQVDTNLTETVALDDNISVGSTFTISLSESITLDDSVSKQIETKLSESIALTDSVLVGSATTASLSESVLFSDNISKQVDTNLTETVALDDSITIGKAVTQTLSETIKLTDVTTSDGSVKSTVEINDSTTNGPVLVDEDRFGESIANIGDLDGDGINDLAVGAPWDNGGGSRQGVLHIMFMNANGSVKSTEEIHGTTPNGPTLGNGWWFGWSVENVGDIDGDGTNEIAAGAILDPVHVGGDQKGAVNIMFMNDNGSGSVDSTVEINDLTTNGPTLNNGDRFGYSIANIGDLDGDGIGDLGVGAAYDDGNGGTNRGAVHIMFMGASGSVKSTVEINDSTANGPTLGDGDYFGRSIENIGDLDGDGINDLAVGAGNPVHSSTKGSIHIIFMKADGSVKSTVEIDDSTANGPELTNGDRFGYSIDNLGDLNGDGVNDLVVGAPYDDNSNTDRGAVHIMFMNTDGSVDSTVEINDSTANGPELTNEDNFGTSIDQVGDLDGNGVNDLAVGAYLDDDGGVNRGAVHIIYMESTKDGFSVSKEINISLSESIALTDSISAGISVTQSLTESISLSDSISNASEIVLLESILLTDETNLGRTVTQSLSESVSLDDSATKQVDTKLTEAISLEDSVSTMKSKIISLSESVLLTDSHSKAIDVKLTESISLADTYSNQVDISLSESIEITDSISAGKSATITLTESIEVSDSIPTDPPNIVARDYETDDANGFTLIENAHRVDTFIIGEKTYAIVTSPSDSGTDGVQVIDVSDPNNIVAKDTLAESNSLELGDAHGVDIFTIGEKTYAIVTAFFDDGVQVIDVSDPTNIVAKDVAQDDSDNPAYTELNGPKDVDVFTIGEKTYAIVASSRDSGVQIIDVSNPNNIVANGELNDTDVLELWNANAVETFTLTGTYAGTYAIVTAGRDDGVQIIDVSNPSPLQNNIVAKDLATDDVDGFTVLDGPTGVKTFTIASNSTATYAIVVTGGPEDGIQIIDVSNPTAIVALDAETDGNNGFNIMKDPSDVDVFTLGTSTYAIVTSTGDNGVTIIDISDPTDISVVDSLVDSGSLELADAKGVDTFKIHGNTYAIVTAAGDEDGVQIIELSTETGFTVNANYKIALTESILLTDGITIGKTVTQSLTESISLEDSATKQVETKLDESISLSDSTSTMKSKIISLSESVLLTDSHSKTIDTKLTESISLADTYSNQVDISLSESIALTDSIAAGMSVTQSLTESISLSDSISNTPEIVLAETVLFTDGTTIGKTVTQSLTEELQLQTTSYSPPTDIIAVDAETDSVNGFDALSGATDVDTFTIGAKTYAIVTGKFYNGVQMIDVSDPTNIVAVDAEVDSVNGFDRLDQAHGVDTFTIGASTYAIVTGPNANMVGFRSGIQVIDVSDPTNIVAKDSMTEGRILGAYNVETFTIGASTYAIVAANRGSGVQMIDVSDPTDIVALDDEYNNNNGFDKLTRATDVAIFTIGSSTYAIVTAGHPLGNGVQIIDVSDPTNIVAKDSASHLDMQIDRAHGVETFTIGASTYAIVTSQDGSDSGVQIIDVSDPTNIVAKDAETDGVNGFDELEWAHDVDIFTNGASTYAIVTGRTDNGVQIIDVSDPTDIVAVDAETDGVNGFTELSGARGVDTFTIGSSTYAIVASQQDDGVQIIKLSTATATEDDAILINKNTNTSLSESIALGDSISVGRALTQSLTESISLSDSISSTLEIILNESVVLTDGITIGKTVTQSLTETLQLQTASQYNDITAVRAAILGNQLVHSADTGGGGSWASLVHLHSDKYVLATYLGPSGPYGSGITTFTISSDGQTITKLDYMKHDTYTSGYNSIVKVDSDTVALAYRSSNSGTIKTFDIDSDGDITLADSLVHATGGVFFNSLVQVDSDTFALAYVDCVWCNGGIYIATVDIDSDGDITAVKTRSEGNISYQYTGEGYNSLVQVDSDTFALAYTGGLSKDGYISTLTISPDGQTITKVDTLEHDEINGTYNSLVQVDSDTFALAYQGNGGGYISTFDIDSDGDITAVKTQSEGNSHKYSTYGATESWGKSFVKMDSDTFALAHTSPYSGGHITTFNISSNGQAITKLSALQHDTDYATRGTMLKVGSDTVAIAYYGGGGNGGIISTVTIGTGADLISVNKNINTSLSESIALGDSISVGRAITQSLTETISFADSVTKTPVINLTESLSLTEEAELQYQPRPSESISFTDTISIGRNPTAPTLAAAPGNKEVVLSWTKPVDPRVNTITDYVIQHSMDDGSTWVTINDGNNAINAYTVLPNYNGCPAEAAPCIANGDEAQFRVQGVNNLGGGQFSVPVKITSEISTANVPTVTVTQKPEKLTVEWIPTNSTIVSDYLVYYGTSVLGPWTLYDDGLSTNTSTDVEGFTAFEPIFVKVQPISSETACPTEESQIRWAKPLETTPQQIRVLFAIPQENTVLLEWKAPKDGGSDIMEYQVRKRIAADPSTSPATPAGPWQHYPGIEITSVRGGEVWHEMQVMGLPSDSRFDFQVRAKNMVGPNDEIGINPGLGWSVSQTIQTQEVKMPDPDVYWGNDGIDNDHDGEIDERDEDRMGPPPFDENFDYDAAGTQYADDMKFDGTKDFGAGQTFGDNTEFVDGQEFDDDVNFTGEGIKFGGSKFKNPETFGVGAEFVGTQEFTGQNTFSANTKFKGDQNFGTNVQTFGAGTHFIGTADFAAGQEFAADTKFASGQEFEHNEDYDFGGLGIDFGHGTNFGKARIFGASANFTAGTQTFVGQNTFAKGTEFAPGQTFSDAQVFGEGQKFADNMKFGEGQTFALDFDFEKEDLEFNDKTVFCQGEEIGAGAEFKGAVELGGATKFKGEEGKPIKFAAGQDFEDHIHDFIGEVEFMGEMDFRAGQDFEGDVEFKGLFDYDDMVGKSLEFKGDVDFYMPPPVLIGDEYYVPPLAIPPGTTFGDEFDFEDMWSDDNGDGVNDEYYLFEPGVEFASDTRFPPKVEFKDGFSKNDMLGKAFTFDEGVFFAGDPVFPAGQKIKPGVMWDEPPTFEAGVNMDPGLALPANTKFSANLVLPAFVAAPYGLVLESVTCSDEHCIPDPDAYLEPGELLPPGVDPAPVVNFITGTNKTFSNPGLGFEMAFDTVAKDGKVSVDLEDPLTVPGTSEGSAAGKRSMISGTSIFENVGSIIDVTVESASTSGEMTVTLPYDENALGGATEDNVVLLHYSGGQWVTVENITIDKANNKVSGTVTSLSPFTVGTKTGTVASGGTGVTEAAAGGAGGGGGGSVTGESTQSESPFSLKIWQVEYDTNENFVRVVVGPDYDRMDVIINTAGGFEIATKVGTHPVLNRAIYEAQLFIDDGPLQISASAYVGPVIIEANPIVTTISAGTGTIVPQEEGRAPVIIRPPSAETQSDVFQKPDDFIAEKQCPIGTVLIDGKCVTQTFQEQPVLIQLAIILLLVLLSVGLLLAISLRRRKEREILASQLVFETEKEPIKPPTISEKLPPVIKLPEVVEEEPILVDLIQSLQSQEQIQKKLHILETQLLEQVNEEVKIRERLTILLQITEIRIKLVHPLLLELKALPPPKRTYKKKRKVLSVQHKAKIAAARRGKKQSEQTKQKIADSTVGRKMSEEHKAKIAAARRGKKQSEQTKQKIADSRIGKKMSESTKKRISKTKKEKQDKLDELIRRYNIVSDEEYTDES